MLSWYHSVLSWNISLIKGGSVNGVAQNGQTVWNPWQPWGTGTCDQYL